MSAEASRELGAVWLELLERGELASGPRTAVESCPCALAGHETLRQHYDLGKEGGVWLTTHRLIVYRPENEGRSGNVL